MKKEIVPRDDGRVILYFTFDDEDGTATPGAGTEARPAPTASNSAVDSDVVTEGER